MGFFDSTKDFDLERRLLSEYTDMFSSIGVPGGQAKRQARGMLALCIVAAKADGTYDLPLIFGDIILGEASPPNDKVAQLAEKIAGNLPRKRAEGVRDADIRWWWNLHDVERRLMEKMDENHKLASFMDGINAGESDSEAGAGVRKRFVTYGNPEDSTDGQGDDRPLPIELKHRINIYTVMRSTTDLQAYKAELDRASSLNAHLRAQIRARKV